MRGGCTCVRTAVGETDFFKILVGLHQGSALSPFLFIMVMGVLGAPVSSGAPGTLLFADDLVITDETNEILQDQLEVWGRNLEDNGLKINRKKTMYMGPDSVKLQGETLPTEENFKYFGTMVNMTNCLDLEVTARIQGAWSNWRKMTGTLCDKRIPLKLKGRIFKAVVRPAILYGAETWTTTKRAVCQLEVNKMRMLRWSAGVTLKDKI